jgi:N-formylglutamate amidohydrolase
MEPVTICKATGNLKPIVASLPHSGCWIPDDIAKICLRRHLETLRNTDWHLPHLYDFLPSLGITAVQANFSRYVIDPNRALSTPLFGPYQHCAIYETNTWGEPIYRERPSERILKERINALYLRYHDVLKQTLDAVRTRFGYVYLLDLHSFLGPLQSDICLGDGGGRTQSGTLLNATQCAFTGKNYDVAVNKTFSGGFITKHYACPPATETLQIEIRYSTYLKASELDLDTPPSQDVREIEVAKGRMKSVFIDLLKHLKSH